jgi:hypothetical protein
MTKEEKLELEFYKNGSAESVLARFVFTEKEEKLVRDAMRSAQLAKPRMKLIRDSDELLKKVAKTREPIVVAEKTELPPKTIAKLELLRLSATKKQVEADFDDKMPTLFRFKSKYTIVLLVIMLILLASVKYFMANKAAQRSTEQVKSYEKQVLELTGRRVDF